LETFSKMFGNAPRQLILGFSGGTGVGSNVFANGSTVAWVVSVVVVWLIGSSGASFGIVGKTRRVSERGEQLSSLFSFAALAGE